MPARNDFAPGEFCWVDLNAHDMESAAAWYGDLFGWKHQVMEAPGGGPPYAFFLQEGAVAGGIGQMSDEMKAQGIPPMWNSYVATADCEATEARVKELGGTVTVPTMEIPGFGKLAFFLDPEGASFAVWQTTNPDSPGMFVNEHGGHCWTELMTRDSSAAVDFYGKLIGWDFAAFPMGDIDYTLIKNDGKDAGGILPMGGPQFEGVPPHWLVYFAVDSCEETAAKVEATGGKVTVPPMEIPVGKFAVLADPQGAAFCVITLSDQPGC